MAKHEFGTWRLVDLDNWLVGNPLVIPKYAAKQESILDSQGTGFSVNAEDLNRSGSTMPPKTDESQKENWEFFFEIAVTLKSFIAS